MYMNAFSSASNGVPINHSQRLSSVQAQLPIHGVLQISDASACAVRSLCST